MIEIVNKASQMLDFFNNELKHGWLQALKKDLTPLFP
jgi:hypothetical protein